MARIKGGIGTGYSGKAGGVIFSEWKGIPVMRAAFSRSKNSWSEKQVMHRQRFKAINDYCRKYKYTLIPQIWNLAAENGHGYNLFVKANTPAFALNGELVETEKLHFSAGKLPVPRQFSAKRSDSDPSKVEVSWINDENLPQDYASDVLMMVCAYPGRFTDPIATGAQRRQEGALIDLPADYQNVTGIWLFFVASKKESYSPDQYFRI
jgi:hypothetical protein